MNNIVLYSTNPFLKLLINQQFRNNEHYVWCGESFDSSKQPAYSSQAQVAPSSDPCSIYRRLREDVLKKDKHSPKIAEVKASLTTVATNWRDKQAITQQVYQEIIYVLNLNDFDYWRPLLYVIPRAAVEHKLELVPPERRASFGVEYTIPNLQASEFDIIEL